jgi:WD40 repeat protein
VTGIAHGSWTHKLGYLADGSLATSGADGVVRCWSPALELLWEHDANLTACCAGGGLVAGFNGRCGAVVVWDHEGHQLHALSGHPTATPAHGAGGNTGCACFCGERDVHGG